MLHLLEWSEDGHRCRAEVRELEGRRVWFISVDDDLPREAFEESGSDDNEDRLRERLVRTVKG